MAALMDVTATQSGLGTTANGIFLRVFVLTGAADAWLQAGAVAAKNGSSNVTAVVTTTTTGSVVFGAMVKHSTTAPAAAAGNTLNDNIQDSTNFVYYGSSQTTAATGVPGATTCGETAALSGNGLGAFAEILPNGLITEDASAPAPVWTASDITVTTAQFTPVDDALLVALVSTMSSTGTTFMDVQGGGLAWTPLEEVRSNATGYAGVWVAPLLAASPPGDPVITAAAGGSTANGIILRTVVLTGAAPAAAQTGGTSNTQFTAATTFTQAVTTTQTGSRVYGVSVPHPQGTAVQAGGTSTIDLVGDPTNGEQYVTFKATALTGTPGATTLGFTFGVPASGPFAQAEILPAPSAALAEDPTAPPQVHANNTTAISCVNFTPPTPSLIVALIAADGAAAVTTMTVTSVPPLNWVELAHNNPSAGHYAGVWIADGPPGNPVIVAARPGKTWRDRHKHWQRILSPPPAVTAPAGITEDASAPASVHTASGSGVTFITTASFTPAANSLILAVAECGNNTGSGAMTCPVTDSLGSTWTMLKRASAGNGGSAEVWALDAGASPAARTVTATGTGGTQATGVSLTVKVLTGAQPAATCLGASATALGTTAYGIAITSTTAGSLVCGGLVDVISATGALTVNGVTTAWQSFLDAGSTEKYAEFRATALTGTPGPVTIGFSTTAGDGQNLVAVEILPAAGGASASPPAGLATAAGTALAAQAAAAAGASAAAGTGTAQSPPAATGANAALATGTGTAQAPAVTTGITAPAGLAAAIGTAQAPLAGAATNTVLASGTGAAQPPVPAGGINTGLAAGTGTAQPPLPSAGPNAALAAGTGTAQAPVPAIAVNAGLATGTGTAQQPAISTAPAVSVNAGLATGTGTAQSPPPAAGANAALAPGTGTAQQPVAAAGVPAGLATAAGSAQGPLASAGAKPGNAAGTGTAASPVPAGAATAGVATGTGTAQQSTVSTVPAASPTAGLPGGTGAAQQPVPAVAASAGLAAATGTAQSATGQTARAVNAGLATGTGTAQPPALALATLAQAQAAQALAAALGPAVTTAAAFTVGALSGSVSPSAVLAGAGAASSALAASTAPSSTITAGTQRTGGPS